MTELAELHRHTERQRRDRAHSNRVLAAMHAELDEKNSDLLRISA